VVAVSPWIFDIYFFNAFIKLLHRIMNSIYFKQHSIEIKVIKLLPEHNLTFWGKSVDINLASSVACRDDLCVSVSVKIINGHGSRGRGLGINHDL